MRNCKGNYLKHLFLVFLLSTLPYLSFAQRTLITGNVSDQDGLPIPGAHVVIKGTNLGARTNAEGNFRINAKNGDVLIVSFMGYKTAERQIKQTNRKLVIVLKEDVQQLNDVVVGYGSAKKLGTVVGSVAKVGGEELKSKPSASVLDALQGKVAGLSIFSTSGEPYGFGSISLHGIGSLYGGSDPLFILDGAPVSKQIVAMMSPSDFESVSVLKDASATSIYGTRAANGVVYITTKKGKLGQTATVSFGAQYGLSSLASRKFFDGIMNVQEYAGYLVEKGYTTKEEMDALLRESPYETRWDRVYFKDNVPTKQFDVSIAGGGEKTDYYISGSYYDQEGVMYRSGFKRYTGRVSLNTEVNNWLKLNLGISANLGEYMQNPFIGAVSASYGSLSILSPPIYPAVDENGKRYDYIPTLGMPHPHYLADYNPATNRNMNFIPQFSVIIIPIKNLTFKSQAGLEYTHSRGTDFAYPSFVEIENERNYTDSKAHRSRSSGESVIMTLTNTLEYIYDISNGNRLTFLLGQESESNSNSGFTAKTMGQTSDRSTMLIHGNLNKTVGDYYTASTFNSFFGRVDYQLLGKYFFDVSLRRDGSSRFGKNNRYANFWSAGALWRISNESFMEQYSWLDDLSLKLSVGTSGNANALSDYASLSLVNNIEAYDDKPAYILSSPGNPDIQWQKQLKTTAGLTVGLFRRINVNLEFYDRLIDNMLGHIPRPSFSGTVGIVENVSKLQNRGIDATISATIFKTRDFYFKPFCTLSYNSEKVLELHNGVPHIIGESSPVSYVVGQPLLYFYPLFWRVDPDNGRAQWFKPGEDQTQTTRNPENATYSFDEIRLKQNTGIRRNPPFNGGFGIEAGYKNLYLHVGFAFSSGKYMINEDRYYTENPVGTVAFPDSNQSRNVLDNWKGPGHESRFPSYAHGEPFTEHDSRLIEDASFIRMKDVTLSYSFSQELLRKTKFLKDLRIFGTARNFLTFTNYTGVDPEFDVSASVGANPSTKELTFDIEVKF